MANHLQCRSKGRSSQRRSGTAEGRRGGAQSAHGRRGPPGGAQIGRLVMSATRKRSNFEADQSITLKCIQQHTHRGLCGAYLGRHVNGHSAEPVLGLELLQQRWYSQLILFKCPLTQVALQPPHRRSTRRCWERSHDSWAHCGLGQCLLFNEVYSKRLQQKYTDYKSNLQCLISWARIGPGGLVAPHSHLDALRQTTGPEAPPLKP